MELLSNTDLQLFLFINHLPHTMLTDWLALTLSGVGVGGLVWFLIGVLLFLKEERKDHRFFVPIFATLTLSWVLVEALLKFIVARPRPTYSIGAIVVGNGAGWYSFPSSHATVSFAMAVILSQYEPRWKTGFYLLALLISFSRIYLGVHYPSDVIAGAVTGWLIGFAVLRRMRPNGNKSGPRKRTHR